MASDATGSGTTLNSDAIGLVNERFTSVETLSKTLMARAKEAAQAIGADTSSATVPPTIDDLIFTADKFIPDFSKIEKASFDISIQELLTQFKGMKESTCPVPFPLTWPSAASYTDFVTPTPPALSYNTPMPRIPVTFSSSIPDLMSVDFNFSLPAAPVYSLPNDPTTKLKDISLASAPVLPIIVFDGMLPVDNIVVPAVNISGGDIAYSSALVDNLKSKLNSNITVGGTGLSPTVEANIYARDQERANLELQATRDKIANEWAKRGFNLPDGVLSSQLLAVDLDFLNKRLDVSRDIAIKQAELEQANIFKSIDSAIAIEGQLISFANSMAQRAVDVSKATADALIAVFNADVQRYTVGLEAYKAQATVFESKVRAQLAEVEKYKAEIDAGKLTQDINLGYIEIYKAQLSGINTLYSLYNTQIASSKLLLDNEKGKIEANKMQIDLYVAKVNSKIADYNNYNAQMEGRKTEAQTYGYEVETYKTKTDNLKLGLTAKLEKDKNLREINNGKIAEYAAKLDSWKSQLASVQLGMDATAKAYETKRDIVKGNVTAFTSEAELKLKAHEMDRQVILANIKLQIENSLNQVKVFEHLSTLHLEAQKGEASVLAQLAAAAYSAISAAAHVQESNSTSQQISTIL